MIVRHATSALMAGGLTAALAPPSGRTWEDLAWAALAAVLSAVLSWLGGAAVGKLRGSGDSGKESPG